MAEIGVVDTSDPCTRTGFSPRAMGRLRRVQAASDLINICGL